jgi:UDP-N-acetylglucosamine 4,6-dehydratase
LKDKTVLITGGTGSFGRNFAKYLLANSELKKLIIFSRDEFKQMQLNEEIGCDRRVRFFLGDIRDRERLDRSFYRVDIVVHAAALKQVPTLEYNPSEAIKTNIFGSQNVMEAAIDCGVKQVLLISTDKAASPVNLYGATKLCAEKLIINANVYSGDRTKFGVVRYGNVMGSRGSIIEKIIKNSNQDVVYITHEEMTRFWINLEQSFELVLFALKNMAGGEIFVPKIPSMKLVDLFEILAPGIRRKVIGIRPGEKLHEILITKEESGHSLELPKYFVILPEDKELFDAKNRFKRLYRIGRKLPRGFVYTSDSNKNWLTKEKFKQIVQVLRKQILSK